MAIQNTKIDSGIITRTFTDEDDHVFCKYRINPSDLATARRFMECAEFFETAFEHSETIEDIARVEVEMQEKLSYVLGYSAVDEIFGEVHALNILASGEYFIEYLIDDIASILGETTPKRQEAAKRKAQEYLKKYPPKKTKKGSNA